MSAGYTKQYFGFGATSIGMFWESRTLGNTSYIFAADSNGDGANGDLIYIPRNTSEMNFVTFTAGGNTFTAEQQTAAFESYIAQDKYLSAHRGEYAERGAVFLPLLHKLDFSLTQDVFKNIKGRRQRRAVPHRHPERRQPAQLRLGRRRSASSATTS